MVGAQPKAVVFDLLTGLLDSWSIWDAAAGSNQQGYSRQLRSELKMLSSLRVADLRAQADHVSRELRELDVRVQQSNWEVDLLD